MPKQPRAALSREDVARSTSFTTSASASNLAARTSRLLSFSADLKRKTSRGKSRCGQRGKDSFALR